MHESSMMTRSAPGEVLGPLGEQSSPGARAAPALPIPISAASLLAASKTAINDRPTQGQASSYASMVKKKSRTMKKSPS